MPSVNTSNIQNQIPATTPNKTADLESKPVKAIAHPQNGKQMKHSVDIVNLSASSITQSPENKKPSTPVSVAEKKLLLQKTSDKPTFSTYV